MKIIHTSDWHLGKTLYGRKRHQEFGYFLEWLKKNMDQIGVEVLLVSGDIFDQSAPDNQAQTLYYQFLCQVANSVCRHVVITAGNHDSPSFLNAPRELLKALNVHVVGQACSNPADEVLVLNDETGTPELIVAAVPYLRERDLRISEAGESMESKEEKLINGLKKHYAQVVEAAEEKRAALGSEIPLVGMGHLFACGGQTVEGDGVRDLYVGSLAHVSADIFPKNIDYLALGHLHQPQKVGGQETRRYSGSPLPLSFSEAGKTKSVCLVEFEGGDTEVSQIPVPLFQQLEQIRGDLDQISHRLKELVENQASVWLEIIYQGSEIVSDLHGKLEALIQGSPLEILRVKNNRIYNQITNQAATETTLEELTPAEVFERRLQAQEVPTQQRPELWRTYNEILALIQEQDQDKDKDKDKDQTFQWGED